jgi:hypothetical protein
VGALALADKAGAPLHPAPWLAGLPGACPELAVQVPARPRGNLLSRFRAVHATAEFGILTKLSYFGKFLNSAVPIPQQKTGAI